MSRKAENVSGDGNGGDGGTGARLFERFAALFVALQDHYHPKALDRQDARLTDWFEAFETDSADFMGPLLAHLKDHPALAQEVKDAFATLVDPQHQSQLAIALAGVYALVRTLVEAAIQPYAQGVLNAAWSAHPVAPLTPPEIALAQVRNTLGGLDGYAEAEKSGIDGRRLDIMALNTGEAISLQDGLLLFRRGQMDAARLEHLVRQSRVRDEWLDMVVALRYAPPPVGEILAGAVQGQLPVDQAATLFQEAGLSPEHFAWMYATHGRPPSPAQIAELVHRGLVGRDVFDQAVRESDIKDKYIDDLWNLSFYIPPVRSIVAMLRAGAISETQARTLFAENGVRPADADGYVAEATKAKTAALRELSQAQTLRFYDAKLITRVEADFRLATLGYDTAERTLMLDFTEGLRHERYVQAVVNRIHARYVGWKIDEAQAATALTTDGIPAEAIADYLILWGIERDANFHSLTPAAIAAAYIRSQIKPAETKRRLLAAGVHPEDVAIVVADAYAPSKVNEDAVMAVVNA